MTAFYKNIYGQNIYVDLELVLAVDVSSSVDEEEYQLQIRGVGAAFRHPDIIAAIESTGGNGIAVAMVQWSDNEEQALVGGWHIIKDAADALHKKGIFIAQLMCLKTMIEKNDLGNICHEHIEFYSFKSILLMSKIHIFLNIVV